MHNSITAWVEVSVVSQTNVNVQANLTSVNITIRYGNKFCTLYISICNMFENNLNFTSLQYINTTGARVCLKELYESKYDPLSVSYTVMTGKGEF